VPIAAGERALDGLASSDILLFEGFRFDRRAGGLFRLDEAGSAAMVPLGTRDRAARLLGRRKGELVSKDEIMALVWPGTVIAGGPAPLIATALHAATGSGYVIALYILFCAIVSITATAFLPGHWTRRRREGTSHQ
jgi:hypothetical protein